MDDDVQRYIKNRKLSGMPDQDIVSELVANGWKQVDAAQTVVSFSKSTGVNKNRPRWIFFISFISLIIVVIVLYLIFYATPTITNS